MTNPIKIFRKKSADKRRMYLDYSCWMADDEVLSAFQVTVSPFTEELPLVVTTSYPDVAHKRLMMFVAGGKTNQNYTLAVLASTDQGQIRQDNLGIMVVPA
jgi:hypothetical protein